MAAVGERIDLRIDDLSHDGRGIGRIDGQVVFVAGGLPGDQLRVRLGRRARGHWHGDLLAVAEPSPQRRRAPCILSDHCGGCSLQAFDDGAEATWKQATVAAALQRIADLDPGLMRPFAPSDPALGTRNRALIPLERTEEGVLRAGYYRRGTHRIVNMNQCPVLDPRIDRLIQPIKSDLEASGWPVDRHGHSGGLRHLGLRVGQHSGEVLITLIASQRDLPGLEELAQEWLSRWDEVVGVGLNLQPEPTNQLMGARTDTLVGRGWLNESFAGLDVRIAADTFFQVHTLQAERVVPWLIEAFGTPDGRLVDAYCGIGTYSLPLAAAGWRVQGVEQHPGAVDLARHNAAANGLADRAGFECHDVAQVLAERLSDANALFVDPPRKGLDAGSLAAIQAARPQRLAYLSCDPATLARDLGRLCAEGVYELRWVQALDLFPNTSHVETLAVLSCAAGR
ncbi:23S rRNA (uracil(1939)-C(5))-methyltransferase RlmD [Cyanobium sp. FGCU-52]|nr:23S rRNA (uracil(1939)-C(5))-methyltransferase RlmD [Cyanobium sp. FGCU52]